VALAALRRIKTLPRRKVPAAAGKISRSATYSTRSRFYELIKKCQLEKNGALMNCPALAAVTWKAFTPF
jgi:hypothetical protein